jgi:hypothetical protein
MSFISEKDTLIHNAENVKMTCLVHSQYAPEYLAGEEYDIWMNRVKLFTDKYMKSHPLYEELIKYFNIRHNSYGTSVLDGVVSILKVTEIDNSTDSSNDSSSKKDKIIFLSHSSRDIEYVTQFVQLLENMHIRDLNLKLICSSLSGYDIPNNKNIYDYQKKQFKKDVFVILLLSKNYYSSVACLNEMGATWITTENYQAILTPEYEYSQTKGAIDASRICFKLNDKYKINELKADIYNFSDSPISVDPRQQASPIQMQSQRRR